MDNQDNIILGIELPTKVYLGKTKPKAYRLSMNTFRNWKHFLKNNVKQQFHKLVAPQLKGAKADGKVELIYYFYNGTNARKDLANVCSLVDKFFSDCLVEAGVIPDDSLEYVQAVHYLYAGEAAEEEDSYIIAVVKGKEQ